MRLLLIRHGESEGNITQVLQGRDETLTERGRRQARALAAALKAHGGIRTLYASPLARAFETAQIVGAALGLEPQPREGLAEINVGSTAGLTFEAWSAQFPEEAKRFHTEGVDYAWPGGESGRQLGERVAAAIDQIIADHNADDEIVAVVTHGGALGWLQAHLFDEPWDGWPSYRYDNCSITELVVETEPTRKVPTIRHNDIAHLTPEPTEEVATGRA